MTLNEIQKKELLYLAMTTIATGDNYILPDLMQVIDRKTLLRLIKVFGGCSIRIPSKSELERSIKVILFYYYTEILGKSESESAKELNINGYSLRYLKNRLSNFKKECKSKYKIPKEFCKSKLLKELSLSLWK